MAKKKKEDHVVPAEDPMPIDHVPQEHEQEQKDLAETVVDNVAPEKEMKNPFSEHSKMESDFSKHPKFSKFRGDK